MQVVFRAEQEWYEFLLEFGSLETTLCAKETPGRLRPSATQADLGSAAIYTIPDPQERAASHFLSYGTSGVVEDEVNKKFNRNIEAPGSQIVDKRAFVFLSIVLFVMYFFVKSKSKR